MTVTPFICLLEMSTRVVLSNVVSLFLCVLVFCLVLRLLSFTLFAFHPILMTLSYIGFTTQAILLICRKANIFNLICASESKKRKLALVIHTLTQIIATYFLLAGFGIVFYDKLRFSKPHFSRCFFSISIGF